MRKLVILTFSFIYISICSAQHTTKRDIDETYFANSITTPDLEAILYNLASPAFEGRRSGELGQKLAAQFIAKYYKKRAIKSATDSTYFQKVPKEAFMGLADAVSENVIAFIKGRTHPNQYVIISAHYDHLGKREGKIYMGADDNASGTSAVLEIAEAFKLATDAGFRPKRSIVFLNLTGEEEGLFGSRYYTENPIFPLKQTVTDLNIDMIGRVDPAHKNNPNYVYVIGSDKLSSELKAISETENAKHTKLTLDYTYDNPNDPNKFYYRSDHYNFAKHNIPIIFYFNGVHDDYHEPTDTPDKINYNLLAKRAKLVFYTAWDIANKGSKLKLDKP